MQRSPKYSARSSNSTEITVGSLGAALTVSITESPSTGVANENTYTMHQPFLALNREGKLPTRYRFDFLHQDAATDAALSVEDPAYHDSFK